MLLDIRNLQYGFFTRFISFHHSLNSLRAKRIYLSTVSESGHRHTKRPTCPDCSKPIRICLCTRLKTPIHRNSIAVTVLQHKLEKKHPLNSTRIATIGLKDVSVSSVSDVNFQARFFIYFLDSEHELVLQSHSEDEISDFGKSGSSKEKGDFVEMPQRHSGLGKTYNFGLEEGNCSETARNGAADLGSSDCAAVITITIEKYGVIRSFFDHWILPNECQKMSNFDHLLDSKIASELLTKGFVVKKLQTKQLNGTDDLEEEFDIKVPPGSILLFPSEKSVQIESIEFEVKNLIVLDGTWAKAKRMYNENPWLKLLPHVKLDIDKVSLYGEVRNQPRAGYLSTIESIVYALKAFGENSDKLDELLNLFESMVGDQRKCRHQKLTSDSTKRN